MDKCIFLDSDILIDVFSRRDPFYENSADLLTLAENGAFHAYTSPLVIAKVHYVLQKFSNQTVARNAIRKIRSFVSIVDMNQKIVDRAINSHLPDFEDALQIFSAENSVMDLLVTRNIEDDKDANLSVLRPAEALALFR